MKVGRDMNKYEIYINTPNGKKQIIIPEFGEIVIKVQNKKPVAVDVTEKQKI